MNFVVQIIQIRRINQKQIAPKMLLRRHFSIVCQLMLQRQFNFVTMNFSAFHPIRPNWKPIPISFSQHSDFLTHQQILTCICFLYQGISVALTLDFNGYQKLLRNKIILEELQLSSTNYVLQDKSCSPLLEPQKPQNSPSQSVPKTKLKVRTTQITTPCKVQTTSINTIKKNKSKPYVLKRRLVAPQQICQKVQMMKYKKKISKNQAIKRENSKRLLDACLIDAAQYPKWRLNQEEKVRIHEQLVLRRVQEWDYHQKRERKVWKNQN